MVERTTIQPTFDLPFHSLPSEFRSQLNSRVTRQIERAARKGEMVMAKLRMFVVQEPVVAASCLIAGFGLFLPAVVRPMMDSFATAKQVQAPPLSQVVAGVTGKQLK